MTTLSTTALQFITVSTFAGALIACDSAPPEPAPASAVAPTPVAAPAAVPQPEAPKMKVAAVPVSPDDPLKGKFTLAEATAGLDKEGKLVAIIETEHGELSCELFDDKAPITVANFVGLARGLRPYKLKGEWVKQPGYDGTTFHRIVRGFMIQGGDPNGNGSGEPGYVIPDEVWIGAKHNERGLLCMANRGPNTNGMQFFITDASAPHLDSGYTIFGKCGPDSVIETLATQPVAGQKAVNPPMIKKVTVARKG